MIKMGRHLVTTITGHIGRSVNQQFLHNSWRQLYTDSTLELIDYKNARCRLQVHNGDNFVLYRSWMKDSLKEGRFISAVSLKRMLHLVEKNEDDIQLLKMMIDKYEEQMKDHPSYKFGPTIMRAFHYLNEPKIALELIKNSKSKGLYNQVKTFTILVDLLYENRMYREVRDVYDILKDKSVSKLVITAVAMACYQENSPESFDFSLKLWEDLITGDNPPIRRVIVILAALALNQKKTEQALNFISYCHDTNAVFFKTIKVVALCDLDMIDSVIVDFQHTLINDCHYFADIIPRVIAARARLNIEPNSKIFQLFNDLKRKNHIRKQTLDQVISKPIDIGKKKNVYTREELAAEEKEEIHNLTQIS